MHSLSRSSFALITSLLFSVVVFAQETTSQEIPAEPKPVERIALVGASATAGFGIVIMKSTPIGKIPGGWSLAQSLREASGKTVVVSDLGTSMFFINPQKNGTVLMERARKSNPDLLVAIDFLFWFCYGNNGKDGTRMNTPKERMKMLEVGLALLDTYKGPMIVGNLPDMSAAIGRMLSRSQVPKPDTIAAINARIQEWSEERPRVRLFPLATIIEKLRNGEPFTIGEHRWDAEILKGVLQRDQLHPTLVGQIALLQVLEVLLAEDEELAPRVPELETDLDVLKARIKKIPVNPKSDTDSEPDSKSSDASDPFQSSMVINSSAA